MFKEKNIAPEFTKEKKTKTKAKPIKVATTNKKVEQERIDEFMIVGYKKDKVLVNINGFIVGLKTDKKIRKEHGQNVRVRHRGITDKNKLNDYKVLG